MSQAEAATCFWVGGTGTWNNSSDTGNWKSTSGGASACAATGGVPKNAGDIATFDGNSGGGTVTVNTNLNIGGITLTAFTGTLDFSANNNTVALTASATAVYIDGAGGGTHTINTGTGVWTLSTGLTSSAFYNNLNTSATFNNSGGTTNIVSTGASGGTAFQTSNKTYGTVSFTSTADAGTMISIQASTFTNLTLTGPTAVSFPASGVVITNAFTWTGTAGNNVFALSTTQGTTASIALNGAPNTCTYCAFRDITFTTNVANGTKCADLGHNSGLNCTGPFIGGFSRGVLIGGGVVGN